MSSVTPMRITTGMAMPVGLPVSRGVVLVRHQPDCDDHRAAADDSEATSTHSGSDAEVVALPASAREHDAEDDPRAREERDQPALPLTKVSLCAATEELERVVERGERLALLVAHPEDGAAPDEEARRG